MNFFHFEHLPMNKTINKTDDGLKFIKVLLMFLRVVEKTNGDEVLLNQTKLKSQISEAHRYHLF